MFNTKTELYQHQKDAFDKLKNVKVCGLFMEMGTGKTRTAIEFVHYRRYKISNIIWFCPVTLKRTIFNELRKHTTLDGIYIFDNETNMKNIPSAFWYIVGIESLSSSARVTLAVNSIVNNKSYCVVDESSFIKGHNSLRTMRITRICERAKYRMILTGTPMTLGVVDLYAQMKFLSPKILRYNSFYSFAANHLEYSDKYPGMIVRAHYLDDLSSKINPFVYQVKKEECIDLPDKLYKSRYCDPTSEQLEWYNYAKNDILNKILEKSNDKYTIFRLFSCLQQIASGFCNRYKIEFNHNRLAIFEDVIKLIPGDEKVIVWCKYIKSLEWILGVCKNANVVHGMQSEKERIDNLEKFEESGKMLVATMQSGGYGLNLNFVKYVVFYENSFNYAHRLQAEDRCHRIGQKHKVTYFDLYCNLNIENYIAKNIYDKGSIINNFRKRLMETKNRRMLIEELEKEI